MVDEKRNKQKRKKVNGIYKERKKTSHDRPVDKNQKERTTETGYYMLV